MKENIYDLLFDLSENYIDAMKVINEMKRRGFTPKDIYHSRNVLERYTSRILIKR